MRLIDADALRNVFDAMHAIQGGSHFDHLVLLGIKKHIEDAPTIDAEPVVRCKDCKHRGDPKECYMCFTEVEDIEGGRMYKFTDMTRSDGFCHKGEKGKDE